MTSFDMSIPKKQSVWVACNPATKDMIKHEAFQLVHHLTILIDVHARTNLKINWTRATEGCTSWKSCVPRTLACCEWISVSEQCLRMCYDRLQSNSIYLCLRMAAVVLESSSPAAIGNDLLGRHQLQFPVGGRFYQSVCLGGYLYYHQ